jgi:hypothetical protein
MKPFRANRIELSGHATGSFGFLGEGERDAAFLRARK